MKIQLVELIILNFILATLGLGCATPHHYPPIKNISAPYKKVTNTFEGEEITSKTNVVKGGLGYLFSLSCKDLNLSEYQVPPEVKNFGKLKKVDSKEFFPIVEQMVLNNIEGTFNLATGESTSFHEVSTLIGSITNTQPKIIFKKRTRPKINIAFQIDKLLQVFPDFQFTKMEQGVN